MIFRRRKGDDAPEELHDLDDDALEDGDELADGPADTEEDPVGTAAPPARPQGPWDADDLPEDDAVERLDLGSLHVAGFDGLEIQVNVDEASGQVLAVTGVYDDGAVQLQAFAAPRSSGIWDEVRTDLRASVAQDGGVVDEADGAFGPELRAKLPVVGPDGKQRLEAVRFVGVDGPRWMLRAVYSGTAADPASRSATALDDLVRGTVVVRGSQPMAPHEALELRLPGQPATPALPEPTSDPLDLGTGQRITEIR